MILPEILLNKETNKYKFNSVVINKVKEAFKNREDKKLFLDESEWEPVLFDNSKPFRTFATKTSKMRNSSDEEDRHEFVCEFAELLNIFTWMFNKKVYKINDDLFDELYYHGKQIEEIPVETLYGFPDWCAWFSIPEKILKGTIKGFFVRMSKVSKYYCLHTTLYIKLKDGKLKPLTLFIGAYKEYDIYEELEKNLKTRRSLSVITQLKKDFFKDQDEEEFYSTFGIFVKSLLNIILFVCQEETDLENYTKKPSVESNDINYDKALNEPFVSKNINVKEIFNINKKEYEKHSPKGTGSEKCPHVRSGFYRVYWTGPGRTIPKVRWVNSVFVNSDKISS